MCVLFFVVIAVVVFQGSMIALGDFSAYNNTEVFLCDNPSLFSSNCQFSWWYKGHSGQAELWELIVQNENNKMKDLNCQLII